MLKPEPEEHLLAKERLLDGVLTKNEMVLEFELFTYLRQVNLALGSVGILDSGLLISKIAIKIVKRKLLKVLMTVI